MKRKILFVTGIFPPDIGGPATYVKNLSDELRSRNYVVDILTLGEKQEKKNDINYLKKKQNYFLRSFKIKRFIENNNYDVIYTQDPFSMALGVALAKTKAKKVLKVVGDNVWEISRDVLKIKNEIETFQNKNYSFRINLMKKIQKYNVSKFDRIITPSNYLKKIVIGWGVNSNKIRVIYNAIETSKFSKIENKSKLRKELEIPGKSFITVARLVPWKGIDLLIDIFKYRKENLIIVGSGSLEKELRKKARKYKNIFFTGNLTSNDVYKYMKISDAFILNTGYEGLPHVVIEAFQVGIPTLISDVCGNPEIVEHKKTGLLFKYNNKASIINALECLENLDKKKITYEAKKSLSKFEWKTLLKETIEEL
jgi:glycosyltransferase involved in cell wall biosynthesis